MLKHVETDWLAFEHLHSPDLVGLSDGSYWKVSSEGARIVRLWRKGDAVEVKANAGSWDWAFRIVHLGSGASSPATPAPGPETG